MTEALAKNPLPVADLFDLTRRLRGRDGTPEAIAVLRAAIEELSEDHRAAFRLHDVEGLSKPEIAEVLQTKPATVRARVHRARLFLRSRLAAYLGGALEVG